MNIVDEIHTAEPTEEMKKNWEDFKKEKGNKMTNNEIVIEELDKFLERYENFFVNFQKSCDTINYLKKRNKKIGNFATSLLSKLKGGKEKEIEEIVGKRIDAYEVVEGGRPKRELILQDEQIDELVSELSGLIPEEREVVAEGVIMLNSNGYPYIRILEGNYASVRCLTLSEELAKTVRVGQKFEILIREVK